jgi:ubiquinone/menaquinone biosynthesis C-methylase UbiE
MPKALQVESASPYEKSVLAFRSDPLKAAIVKQNFLDADLTEAVDRYARSAEFSQVLDLLSPYLSAKSTVIELGGGRGLLSLAMARRGTQMTMVELDPSEEVGIGALVKSGLHRGLPLTPIRADLLRLPFAEASFDVAMCRSVLHHVEAMRAGLKEINRVLKPGGAFLALNEHIVSPFSDGRKFLASHPAVAWGVNEHAYPVHTYWWNCRVAGFRNIRFLRFEGFAADFAAYVSSVNRHDSLRRRMIRLPWVGGIAARTLHGVHTMKYRHLRYLSVPEEFLPAVSLLAFKPKCSR